MLADANSRAESPVRQRLTSVERRAAIVKAAVDLFSTKGFRGTTTREIAAAVGVTEPVLYQHFATKRELHTAIVDQMMAEIPIKDVEAMELAAKGSDDTLFLTCVGEQILRWYTEDTHHIRMLLFSALEGQEIAQLWEERATAEFMRFVEGYFERRFREGALQMENPVLAARAFIGMVGHYALMTTVVRCPFSSIPQDDVIKGFIQIFLNGVRRIEGSR